MRERTEIERKRAMEASSRTFGLFPAEKPWYRANPSRQYTESTGKETGGRE
jgi:hypothetical protein